MKLPHDKKKRGSGIIHVSSLFDKYKKRIQAPQGVVIVAVLELVTDIFDFNLTKEQCVYNVTTKTLIIHAPGMLKTEIMLRKKEVLAHLRARLGEKSSPREIL